MGAVTVPLRDGGYRLLRIREDGPFRHGVQILVTFLLATVAWVFFKASSLSNALSVLGGMVRGPLWVHQSMGLDRWELLAAAGGLLLLLLADLLSKRYDLWAAYLKRPRLVRWCILWALLFGCLIFGSYGAGYDAQDFMYGFSF